MCSCTRDCAGAQLARAEHRITVLEAAINRVKALHPQKVWDTFSGTTYCTACCDGLIEPGPCETLAALEIQEI